jgi:oxepin-CoA hydrolase/3-oxo-5,6-dehydrosuberyl-CoA semialdehyde dehydrogenase
MSTSFQLDLEAMLAQLSALKPNTTPTWGQMSPQRMVEHLADALYMSIGQGEYKLEVPEERIERMQAWLESDKPMAKDVQVSFATPQTPLRNDELETAVDEFTDAFLSFLEHYEENESAMALHPFYGQLNYAQWQRLHTKHFAHHFEQFGLI